jgi:hypothetical protein
MVENTTWPVVGMVGEEYRTFSPARSIQLQVIPVQNCFQSELPVATFKTAFAPVKYTWEIYDVLNAELPLFIKVVRNVHTSTIMIAPYFLRAGKDYKVVVTLNLTANSANRSSSLVFYVRLLKYAIRANLLPHGKVAVRNGEHVSLNASCNFYNGEKTPSDAIVPESLTFDWTCTVSEVTLLHVGCGDMFTVYNSSSVALFNTTVGGVTGSSYRILLTVRSNLDGRTDSTFVTVLVDDTCCTKLYIPPVSIVNSESEITIDGYVTTSLGGTSKWSLLNSGIELRDVVLTPLSAKVVSFFGTTTETITRLRLSSNSLTPDRTYTFELNFLSSNQADLRVATIDVSVNDIPQPGLYTVSPRIGFEARTSFRFTASQWTDAHLPLDYHFSYYDVINGTRKTLRARHAENTVVTLLPRGGFAHGNDSIPFPLTCTVEVYDILSAHGSLSLEVSVNSSNMSSDDLSEFYDILENDSDTEVVLELSDSAVTVPLNCSAAPDCLSLNRDNCSLVDNTCGECFQGNFIGVSGHANSLCYVYTAIEGVESCYNDESCGPLRKCESFTCVVISKVCSTECYSHGTCYYTNSTNGLVIPECFLDDYDICDAKCLCDEGFNGVECTIPGNENRAITEIFKYVLGC